MRIRACLAATMLTMVIGASAQTPPPAAGSVTACSLLTKDDAAAALGEAVTGPRATAVPSGPSSCEFTGSGIHSVTVSLFHFDAQMAAMYKAMCAQKGTEGLTGLGDVSCWYNDKHGELQVMKGLSFFSIELRKSGDPTASIVALAQKIYGRMK